MKTTLDDKVSPMGLSLKKYYGKPMEDRTLFFAPILLICNGVYGKKIHWTFTFCAYGV